MLQRLLKLTQASTEWKPANYQTGANDATFSSSYSVKLESASADHPVNNDQTANGTNSGNKNEAFTEDSEKF
jgi:hypothetical protein